MKETLQFLKNGRRDHLLVLSDGQEPAEVQSRDQMFAVTVD